MLSHDPVRKRHGHPARRALAFVLGAAALVVLALAGWTVTQTSYAHVGPGFVQGPASIHAPAWSRPCWRRNRPPFHNAYTPPCARVVGRVVLRQHVDPDGDGDAHLIVIAGVRVVNLKLPRAGADGAPGLPGLGSRVTAVGELVRGRWPGVTEVRAAWTAPGPR